MRKLIILFAVLVVAVSCEKSPFILKGTIDGMTEGKVILSKYKGEAESDTAIIVDGKFEFKGDIQPDQYTIAIEGKKAKALFFLENGIVTFKGHADSLFKAELVGSKLNDQNEALKAEVEALQKKYEIEKLGKEYRSASPERKKELLEVYNKFKAEASKIDDDFIAANPASIITVYKLRMKAYEMSVEQKEAAIAKVDTSLHSHPIIVSIQERIQKEKAVQVGKIAPDFTMNDAEGNPIKLSDLYKKHKFLLIDFWASWCGPCRHENPNVVKAYKKYNKKGFSVFGVSLDQNKERWLEAIEKDGLTWEHVSDLKGWKNAAANLYAVNGIPANFLVDNTGKILAKGLREQALLDKIEELTK
ncbi:AhpC/TSA family protein [Prolixibacteraceae bacterium JC049]|nr:AhpC/TSA family protein [Prolixibacteraceae bacterium JC049]